MNITVLGFGSWGMALACMLNRNGHSVKAWDFNSERVNVINETGYNEEFLKSIPVPKDLLVTSDLEKALYGAKLIVLAVPSKVVRNVMSQIKPFVEDSTIIVNVAKGIEDGTLMLMSEVIADVCPTCKVAVLSGPSHAEEVAKDIPTTCVATSVNSDVATKVQDVFMNSNFRVYTNNDVIGVEIGGALKNVIALAAGISDGLGYGDNTKAALMTRGIVEISRLGVAMGGDISTFSGLTGVGDLIVTCTSMHSRNRRAGILIGQGKTLTETLDEVHMVVEGVNSAKAALALSKKFNVSMPIIEKVNEVLFEGRNPGEAVNELMTRTKTDEVSFKEGIANDN